MPLRAVADDGHGLAVEEREVRFVVVDHRTAGYPTAPDGEGERSGGRCGEQRASGNLEAPVGRGVWREASVKRCFDLFDLRLRPRQHGVVERIGEVERRLPHLLEARVAAGHIDGLDRDLGEADVLEQIAHHLAAAEREWSRRRGTVGWGW